MSKNAYKFFMVLVTAKSVGYALGIDATHTAMFSGLFCAIFSFLLFGHDFTFFKKG